MKSLVTYYSFSGNTDNIAKIFGRLMEAKGVVDIQRLRAQEEIASFIGQCKAARMHKRAALADGINFDASSYDLILIGSPVWAFAPAPAMNTFLDKLSGIKDKRVVVVLTSGSGLGVGACFKYIKRILELKGPSRIDEINIPDRKNKDWDFVTSSLQKVL